MSHGSTRRVSRLLSAGVVSDELLRAAEHEADLLAHPYTGLAHLELARLRLAGRDGEREALRGRLTIGVSHHWWRPRGLRSALRQRGRRQTEAARQAAERAERRSN